MGNCKDFLWEICKDFLSVRLYILLLGENKKVFETVSRDEVTRREEIETVSCLVFFRDETVSLPALKQAKAASRPSVPQANYAATRVCFLKKQKLVLDRAEDEG